MSITLQHGEQPSTHNGEHTIHKGGRMRTMTHTHTNKKRRLESYYSIFNGSETTLPSNVRCPRWETESVMRLSVSVVISSPRWWRCVACLGSCVCLLFAGGDSFFTGLCLFTVMLLMWRDQTGAASRPHKKRGNRISPSGERFEKPNWGFFFYKLQRR